MNTINTNIDDTTFVHDHILHPPIEKQLYDICVSRFEVVTNSIVCNVIFLILDGMRCPLEITKKGVRLSLLPSENVNFGVEYPSVKIAYNKDVFAKLHKFFDKVKKIKELEHRAEEILKSKLDYKLIAKFLNQELATEHVEVSFWNENLFSGLPISFYLHPRGDAPGDGVLVCIEDECRIVPFWNDSTERRTRQYPGNPELIEKAVGCMMTQDERRAGWKGDLNHMKKKIAAAENLQAKVDAFNPNKSAYMLRLLAVKRQADVLVAEFKGIK